VIEEMMFSQLSYQKNNAADRMPDSGVAG